QQMAVQNVKAGAKARDIDSTARIIIEKAGYGEKFVHGLGHGIGLEVHEPPTLNPESKDKLKVGNVVTIEPAVYIAGFGGIRIEDTVLVNEYGAEKLTDGLYTIEASLKR
ncbi:MAG: M24 family metallopeptidase, partial [Candidatus Bathyarchaeia archaeon]